MSRTTISPEDSPARPRGVVWGKVSLVVLSLNVLLYVFLGALPNDPPNWVGNVLAVVFFAAPVCSVMAAITGLFRDCQRKLSLIGLCLAPLVFCVNGIIFGATVLKQVLPYQQ